VSSFYTRGERGGKKGLEVAATSSDESLYLGV